LNTIFNLKFCVFLYRSSLSLPLSDCHRLRPATCYVFSCAFLCHAPFG